MDWSGPSREDVESGKKEADYEIHSEYTLNQFIGVYTSPIATAKAVSLFMDVYIPDEDEQEGPVSSIQVSTCEIDDDMLKGELLVDLEQCDDEDEIYEMISEALVLREKRHTAVRSKTVND
jgi:hypothetical protein